MDGEEFAVVRSPMTIGRLEDQDVCLSLYRAVSRHHAQLVMENDEYWLEDAGSTCGTFVSGEELKIQGRTKIVPGTSFRLGTWATLRFVMKDSAQRVTQQVERLMRRLSTQLETIPPEKAATLKDQLISMLSRLVEARSEDEFLILFGELAAAIESALGRPVIREPHDVRKDADPAEAFRQAQSGFEGDSLNTLKTFFKSNLDEIINRLEAQQSGEGNR